MKKNNNEIAILCSGIGITTRGFEAFAQDLFTVLKDDLAITLFKGGGSEKVQEKKLWCVKRNGLIRFLKLPESITWKIEFYSFILSFLPFLLSKRFELVIVSDFYSANFLMFLKKILRLSSKIIISNGGMIQPKFIKNIDFIFQVSEPEYKKALYFGIPKDKLSLLPYGVFIERFRTEKSKEYNRKKFGIPLDRYVLLAVGQIDKTRKRIDFLIKCFSKLEKNRYFLVLAGNTNAETNAIKEIANQYIKEDIAILENLDYSLMLEIYALADCLIHCALIEGFGKIFVEAMAMKIPIIAHRTDITEWVIDNRECLINMNDEEELLVKIVKISNDANLTNKIVEKNFDNVVNRFDWSRLKKDYIVALKHISGHESLSI